MSIAGEYFIEGTIRESLGEDLRGRSATVFAVPGRGAVSARRLLSVRFLGRKVYVGVVVVLVSAMMHGLSEGRVKRLWQVLRIDRRTLQHWREWWIRTFVRSDFLESGTWPVPASDR